MDRSYYEDPLKELKPWARTLYATVKPKVRMKDLVLDAETQVLLETIVFERKHGRDLKNWGFETQGMVVLFTGLPGTGKTMAAEAIASALKKDLLIVRADKVHTGIAHVAQENIGRLFEEVKGRIDVLFIDEAEAMLGQRIQNPTGWMSIEHNGNICVFLQRIEEFAGLLILATNHPMLLDPALERRMSLEVPFKIPGYDERIRLWKQYFPKKAPLSLEADIEDLAARFVLTGSSIKNAVRQAARFALMRAGENAVISHQDLVRAAEMEITRQARSTANLMKGDKNEG